MRVKTTTKLFALSLVLLLACESVDHMREAQMAFERAEYEETIEVTADVLEDNESHREARELKAAAHRKLALSAVDSENFELALEHFVEAARAEPSRARRGQDGLRASKEAQDLGNQELAVEMAKLAVEADPSSLEIRVHAAKTLDNAGDGKSAIPHYLWAWEVDRKELTMGLRLGALYAQNESWSDSQAIYSRILEISPEHVQAGLGKAEACEKLRDLECAEAQYRQLIEAFPENALLLFRYADFLDREGRTERAAEIRAKAQGELPATRERKLRPLKPSKR